MMLRLMIWACYPMAAIFAWVFAQPIVAAVLGSLIAMMMATVAIDMPTA